MRLASLSILAAVTASACADGGHDASVSPASFLAPTAEDMAGPVYKACVAAIADETGRPQSDVAVFDYVYSEASTSVTASVVGADAPWRCRSWNDGSVFEVMYTGSEGAL